MEFKNLSEFFVWDEIPAVFNWNQKSIVADDERALAVREQPFEMNLIANDINTQARFQCLVC